MPPFTQVYPVSLSFVHVFPWTSLLLHECFLCHLSSSPLCGNYWFNFIGLVFSTISPDYKLEDWNYSLYFFCIPLLQLAVLWVHMNNGCSLVEMPWGQSMGRLGWWTHSDLSELYVWLRAIHFTSLPPHTIPWASAEWGCKNLNNKSAVKIRRWMVHKFSHLCIG